MGRVRAQHGAQRLRAWYLVGLLCGLMVYQGGFFPKTAVWALAASGVVVCVGAVLWLLRGGWQAGGNDDSSGRTLEGLRAYLPSLISALAFTAIALLMALSAGLHGLPASRGFIEASPWLLAALASALCTTLDERGSAWLLRAIAWLGVGSAVLGVGMFVGVPSIGGAMTAGRLQFLFQYANAAGAWFGCASLLCYQQDDVRLSRCASAPVTALLLTQSMGSLLLFALAAAVCMVSRIECARRSGGQAKLQRELAEACGLIIQGAIAGLAFVVLGPMGEMAWGMLAFATGSIAFYANWPRIRCFILKRQHAGVAFVAAILTCLAGVAVLAVAMQQRIVQAHATFGERLAQMQDAWMLLADNPALGIGPNQWLHVYTGVQSADYQSAVVHSSYLQVGLDAGVLAAALLLVLLAGASVVAIVDQRRCVWPLLVLLAAHAAVDFDFHYAFFLVLVGILATMALGLRRSGPLS